MQTFLMRAGIEERDYTVEIPQWKELCTVVQADAAAEEDEAIALLLGASSVGSSMQHTVKNASLSSAQLKAKQSVTERIRRARKAYSYLYASIPVDLRQLVADVPQGYAYGVWSFLEKRFRNTEQDSVMALWKEFTTMVQDNEESFDTYKARVDSARELLVNAKQPIPEGLYASLILWNLQPHYSTAVLTLKTGDRLKDPAKIDWTSITDYMAQYERSQVHLGEIGVNNHERTMAARANAARRQNTTLSVKCFNCHKKGHYATQCDQPDRRQGKPTRSKQENDRSDRGNDASDASDCASDYEGKVKKQQSNLARGRNHSAILTSSDDEDELRSRKSYMCRATAGGGFQNGTSTKKPAPLRFKSLVQSLDQDEPGTGQERCKNIRSSAIIRVNAIRAVEQRL